VVFVPYGGRVWIFKLNGYFSSCRGFVFHNADIAFLPRTPYFVISRVGSVGAMKSAKCELGFLNQAESPASFLRPSKKLAIGLRFVSWPLMIGPSLLSWRLAQENRVCKPLHSIIEGWAGALVWRF
jgi:hypothetical protein